MTQSEADKQVELLMKRFDEVNSFFIETVAKRVKKVGELIPSDMHTITIMAEMNEDMAAINKKLADAMQKTIPDLYRLYGNAMNDHYSDPRFARALKGTPLSDTAKARLRHYAEAVSRQTAGALVNLSNTTLTSQIYRHTVDNAILAVSSGLTDYRSATRRSIRDLGYNGLQMRYPSGYHRRLDSAVRQNIVDGVNQIAQNGSLMMGEELGYDAIELSAHARSAPDHEPLQGRVFLKAEFDKMQTEQPFTDVDGRSYHAIRRPIGEWNCMHIAMSFSTKYSVRRYTDDQLKKWAEDNEKGCEIDGKHCTTYEAAQTMRRLETMVRREKDAANAARIVGDEDLRRQCQERINALARKYQEVAKASGLKPRKERMSVEGFKPANTAKPQKRPAPVHKGPMAKSAVRNTNTHVSFDPNSDYSLNLEGYPQNTNIGLSKASRDVAQKGGSDQCEHMRLVDLDTGDWTYYETNGEADSVGYDFWQYLKDHKNSRYAFVHNHNTDSSFSETDMRTLLTTKQIPVMIAVRNDGVKYVAERKGDIISNGWFDELYEDDIRRINEKVRNGEITPAERNRMRELKVVDNLLRDYTKAGRLVEFDGRQ